jgi:hypothetical protein
MNDLFPVDPRTIVGAAAPYLQRFNANIAQGMLHPLDTIGNAVNLGTEGVGQGVAYGAGKLGVPNPEGLGRDVTAALQSETGGGFHPGAIAEAAAPLSIAAAAPIAKRIKAPKDLPNVTWNPTAQAWEGGPVKGVPLSPPPHVTIPDIYNSKDPSLAAVPNVPQVELPRYEPPKGLTPRVADLVANAAVRQRMLDSIQQGKDVGMSWHNTQPAIQDAIDALGSEQAGRDAFKRFIDYNAATSALNKVPTNLREASYYYYRDKNAMGPVAVNATPPDPYHGGMANKGHTLATNAVLGGTWGQGDVSKTPSYGANLEGNLTPIAMDRHAVRAPAMMSEDPRWLQTQIDMPDKSKFRPQDEYAAGNLTMEDALKRPVYWEDMPKTAEYAPLEDYYQSLAKDAGMAPGQAQASGWVGNAKLTGVDTDPTKTFLDMYQDRIKNTAYRMGKSPEDVVRGFWQGQHPLLSVGAPAAAAGAAAVPMLQGGQPSDQQGAPPPGPQASLGAPPVGTSPEYLAWWQRLQDQMAGGPSATPT